MALLLNAAIGIFLLCVPSLGGSSLPSTSAPVLPPSLAFLPRGGQSPPRPKGSGEQRSIVLVIDVDNCLYSEAEARSASADLLGVEEQIIRNSNAFCESHHNLTADQSQDLYLEYGSTVEGLRRTRATDDIQEIRGMLRSYYNEVYDGIDTSCLLSHRRMGVDEGSTGYSHVRSSKRGQYLANVLKTVPCPLYFASNSPRGHVLKVLTALGLRGVPVEGILTPDTVYEGGEGDGGVEPYPTKSSPDLFYRRILDAHPDARIILLDDSRTNVDKASTVGIDGLQVTADFPLEKALAAAMGHISFPFGSQSTGGKKGESNPYEFSDVKYLKSKNLVDAAAINLEVWQRLAKELKDSVVPSLEDGVLRIADVGAGLLSMLRLMVQGGSGKASLFDELQSSDGKFPDGLKQIHYYAYESNTNLVEGCKDTMTDLGFTEVAEFVVGGRPEEIIFRGQLGGSLDDDASNLSVTVHLRTKDFVAEDSRNFQAPNLVVGCCFADLFDPHDLAQSLISFTRLCRHGGGCDGKHSSGPLVYFPITFSGTTRFNPAMPFETCSRIRPIPSDTRGFQLYSKSLSENLGHNLDTNRLIEAMEDHGGNLISRGPADWLIDPSKHRYLWETMIYFFGTCGAAEQMIEKWNSTDWLSRARKHQPCIQVSNIDVLFQLEPSSISKTSLHLGAAEEATVGRASEVQEIEFQSPRKVGITTKGMRSVGPNQVEVTSAASLISSGTELKIFNGMFEEAALDVNIKGMADDSMAYPLSYGYSLVGKVTKCGSEVADADELLGRLVFAFSPHSSHVVVDRDAIMLVPPDMSAEDAIFMPSVETALSIVHDAHIRVGENVAVYGQGLIGLLITSILSLSTTANSAPSPRFGTITAFDTISNRLAMASTMGASQALSPVQASNSGPFDVSIEVSGNANALQSAIDNTSSGGRVIVGSWYGKGDVALKLGIDFHRSHKTIKTSQVSTIPAKLSTLWSKERRFELTWELMRAIRPSQLLSKTVTLDEAQNAYESLDKGDNIAISFRY